MSHSRLVLTLGFQDALEKAGREKKKAKKKKKKKRQAAREDSGDSGTRRDACAKHANDTGEGGGGGGGGAKRPKRGTPAALLSTAISAACSAATISERDAAPRSQPTTQTSVQISVQNSAQISAASKWRFVPLVPPLRTWIYVRVDSDPNLRGQLAFLQRIHRDAVTQPKMAATKKRPTTKAGRRQARMRRLNNNYLVLLTGSGQRFLIPMTQHVMWRVATRPEDAALTDAELSVLVHPLKLPNATTAVWRCRHSDDGFSCCTETTRYYMYCTKHRDDVLGVRIGKSSISGAGCGLFATRRFVGPKLGDPEARDVLVCSYGGYYHLKEDFDRYMERNPAAYTTNYALTLPGGSVVVDAQRWRCHGAMINQAPRKHAVNCVFVYAQALTEGKEAIVWIALKHNVVIEPGEEFFVEYNNEEWRRSLISDELYDSATTWK